MAITAVGKSSNSDDCMGLVVELDGDDGFVEAEEFCVGVGEDGESELGTDESLLGSLLESTLKSTVFSVNEGTKSVSALTEMIILCEPAANPESVKLPVKTFQSEVSGSPSVSKA
jgi:hypothetical protein